MADIADLMTIYDFFNLVATLLGFAFMGNILSGGTLNTKNFSISATILYIRRTDLLGTLIYGRLVRAIYNPKLCLRMAITKTFPIQV